MPRIHCGRKQKRWTGMKHGVQEGFTLIELLVVVIIIAILASIALPTFLGARAKAQDAAAVTLVRNALTVIESANVDAHDYRTLTQAQLALTEPMITWNVVASDLVDPAVPSIVTGAQARSSEVEFYGQSATSFDIASASESGNLYGIQVVTSGLANTKYVKVKVIEGDSVIGW